MTAMISHSDNLTLRAWRRGELAPADADAFETRLFFEPALAEAATIDMQLTDAFADIRERETGQDATYGKVDAALQPQRSAATTYRHRSNPWSILFAAGVGALAVLPITKMLSNSPTVLGNVELVSVDARRGTEGRGLLVAPRAGTQAVVIEIPAPATNAGPYTASIVALADNRAVVSVSGLVEVDGLLSLTFARRALAAGDYRVEVATADGAPLGEPLQVQYQP